MALSDRFRGRLGGGVQRQWNGDPKMFNAARDRDMGPAQGNPPRGDVEPPGNRQTIPGGVLRQFGPSSGSMGPDNQPETKFDPRTGIERAAAGQQRHRLSGRTINTQRDQPLGIRR